MGSNVFNMRPAILHRFYVLVVILGVGACGVFMDRRNLSADKFDMSFFTDYDSAPPAYPVECGTMQSIRGQQNLTWRDSTSIASTFSHSQDARDFFTQLSSQRSQFENASVFGQTVSISLDRSSLDAMRSQITDQFNRVDIFTLLEDISDDGDFIITISARAPSPEMAKAIRTELRLYHAVPHRFYLRPPWMPVELSETEKISEYKARYTFERISTLTEEFTQSIGPVTMSEFSSDLEGVRKRIQQASKAGSERAFQTLMNGDDPNVDPNILELNRSGPDPSLYELDRDAWERETDAWKLEMGRHMGQLPMEGDRFAKSGLDYVGSMASLQREEWLHFELMGFENPHVGLIAFADYLCDEGVSAMKYNLTYWDNFH